MRLVATITVARLANYMGQAQKRWVRGIQTRVDVTASVLGSMKASGGILTDECRFH